MEATTDFRPLMEDLLRLGLQDVPGYANRTVSKIQIEHITNPYGRQPPHVLIFPNGRVERASPFQNPVPGYAADVLAVELMGYVGQPVTAEQTAALAAFCREVRTNLPGRFGFTGNADLVAAATTEVNRPGFMGVGDPRMAAVPPAPKLVQPSNVQQLFDVLGTPPDRRNPLPPGSLFNSVSTGGTAQAVVMRSLFKAPGTRMVVRLVVVPSHDATKPEPAEASAYSLAELRKGDQRVGMSDFRGHYLIAKDGSLVPGRDIEAVGNCWPGKNEQSIQLVLAGNGKNPTVEQRETLYHYAAAMRKHYECPLQASIKDIIYGEQLIGLNPTGMMQDDLAQAALINAPIAALPKNKARAG